MFSVVNLKVVIVAYHFCVMNINRLLIIIINMHETEKQNEIRAKLKLTNSIDNLLKSG